LAKTTRARMDALQSRLLELHPYELPELLAVEAAGGLPAYLDWVANETWSPAPVRGAPCIRRRRAAGAVRRAPAGGRPGRPAAGRRRLRAARRGPGAGPDRAGLEDRRRLLPVPAPHLGGGRGRGIRRRCAAVARRK